MTGVARNSILGKGFLIRPGTTRYIPSDPCNRADRSVPGGVPAPRLSRYTPGTPFGLTPLIIAAIISGVCLVPRRRTFPTS